ncbi:unnamed protein product [Discosporangium mesarthrocarpum]
MGASASTLYAKGGAWGLRFVPSSHLMDQVHASLVPSERIFLLECLDEIERRCSSLVRGKKNTMTFLEEGVMEVLIELLNMFKIDEVLLRVGVKTLLTLCQQDPTVLRHFLDLGGRDALDEVSAIHEEDPFIRADCKQMKKVLLQHSRMLAKRDAAKLELACRFCPECRTLTELPASLLMEKGRGSRGLGRRRDSCMGRDHDPPNTTVGGFRGPARGGGTAKAQGGLGEEAEEEEEEEEEGHADPVLGELERIQLVMGHMERNPLAGDIVEPCVDALIALGKTGITEAIVESKCVWLLVKAMEALPKRRSLQWKGVLAVIHLAKADPVCSDLGKAGVVPLLMKMWKQWDEDEMRQLLLWAFNETARLEVNQLRMCTERLGAMLREVMEPLENRLDLAGGLMTAEQAGHYCIPVRLKRLFREKALGTAYAKEEASLAQK